ncbi:MAG: hypothetical protein IPH97_13400 [Ignavibacteriales bacterium]|nr:hypothetical protein [Ignavibacteriales bacterium]
MIKSFVTLFVVSLLFTRLTFAQAGVGLTALPPDEAKEYAKPLATFLGSYFNSGGYYSANLPKEFQFKFSIIGSYIIIPKSQQTFTPNPGLSGYENFEETATITGSTGNVYLGPQGFISYPHGFDVASLPSGIYQAAGSYYGTELLLRFFPKIKVSDSETGFWGIGLKHSISQWIKDPPLDFSIQLMLNNFNFEYVGDNPKDYVKTDSKNFAVNVHASKTFNNWFIAYGGVQYETSSMDLNYYFRDPNELYPQLADQVLSTNIKGSNNYRITVGGAVKFSVLVLNVDLNLTSQFTITSGLSLQF